MPEVDRSVLVVDDEPLVRFSLVALLEDIGWQVSEAASVSAALDALEGGLQVSAVIADVIMSGQARGLDLASEVRRRWPKVGVLLISGLPLQREPHAGVEFLGKPFSQAQLTEALGRAIASTIP